MQQLTFAAAEHAGRRRTTRRERFLARMETVVPWARLQEWIEPHYPASGRPGGRPIGAGRLLRMWCLQRWYALPDEGVEDALYDSHAMRAFVGVDLGRGPVPDATTLLRFRRRLAARGLTAALLREVDAALAAAGLAMRRDRHGEVTLVAAPVRPS